MNNIMIDIDGTVADDIAGQDAYGFANAGVLDNAVESVNRLYDQGHRITFFTARREEYRVVTEIWLNKYKFKYHTLLMNKPEGGKYIWIDNLDVKGIKFTNNWQEILEKL